MGQILHGSATTTLAIRAAIQRSKAPLKDLAAQHGFNQKTVSKWSKRSFVHDAPMGPKIVRSTVLTAEEEATVIAFRKHTLLPLDNCLYALQATIRLRITGLVIISRAKRLLRQEIPADLRLRFLEIMNKLAQAHLSLQAMQTGRPARDTAMKMLDEIEPLCVFDNADAQVERDGGVLQS